MPVSRFVFLLEMTGTAAFAISGVMVARDRKMDIFGACLLGCTTACGGGVIRDILLGVIPPMLFRTPVYIIFAFAVSVITFVVFYFRGHPGPARTSSDPAAAAASETETGFDTETEAGAGIEAEPGIGTGNEIRTGTRANAGFMTAERTADLILNLADSLGLAAFVVVGYRGAVAAGYSDNAFLCIFVGVLTGIGGGILRDVLAGQMPLIMSKRVYGVAAIIGAVVYYLVSRFIPSPAYPASLISIAVTVIIRFLAIHYHWNLPKLE